jgi:hypothetical protein
MGALYEMIQGAMANGVRGLVTTALKSWSSKLILPVRFEVLLLLYMK